MNGIDIILLTLSILAIVLATGSFIIRQQTLGIIERLGRFHRVTGAGLRFCIPLIDKLATRLNLKIQQLDVEIETKTKDDVFIHLMVSVQYHIIEAKAFEAHYKLAHPEEQIQAFIFDLVRAEVPKLILDDVFSRKDDIASAVREELSDEMQALRGVNFVHGLLYALIGLNIGDKRFDDLITECLHFIGKLFTYGRGDIIFPRKRRGRENHARQTSRG
jgi:regulator of protease activity HflC (stomatin/prohibitin superfamily)